MFNIKIVTTMSKVKDLLKCFDGEFLNAFFGLIIALALSIGIQSFFFWFGELSSTPENVGYFLDIGVFVIWVLFASNADNSDLFPFKGTKEKGAIYLNAVWVATVGVYAYMFCAIDVWAPALCFVVMLWGWIMLKKLYADTDILSYTVGISLFYCIGTYVAMLLNGIAPLVDVYGIVLLALAALIVWFKPVFE